MSSLLKNAYAEYEKLRIQLEQVAKVINLLGGTVPLLIEKPDSSTPVIVTKGYPQQGTWKNKIIFVLESLDSPATVAEIASKLVEIDPSLDGKDLKTRIGQYCYLLSESGDIKQEKSPGHPNKYFPAPKKE